MIKFLMYLIENQWIRKYNYNLEISHFLLDLCDMII